jgi:hypothetical protein
MSLQQWLKSGSVKVKAPVTPGLPDPSVNILIDSHSLLVIIIGLTVGILVSHTPGGQDFNLLTCDV